MRGSKRTRGRWIVALLGLVASLLALAATTAVAPAPAGAAADPTLTVISTGPAHSCGITAEGAAKCWGSNVDGRLGIGSNGGDYPSPTQVVGLTSGVTSISVGTDHTCAVVSGAAKCWGNNSSGQLGIGTFDPRSVTPVQVTGLTSGVTAIDSGHSRSCAVVSGAAQCWGDNGNHGVGVASPASVRAPVQVTNLTSGVTAITTGADTSCAIVSGAAKCWGSASNGLLGSGTNSATHVPQQVTGLTSGVTMLSVGTGHTCGVVSGAAKCWGAGASGKLGNNTTSGAASTPVQVTGLTSGVTAISAAPSQTCAAVSGAAMCWGDNANGSLGNGTTTASPVPVAVTGLTSGVTDVSAATSHACALVSAALRCWGGNPNGQLGIGWTDAGSSKPVTVLNLAAGASDLAIGLAHTCTLVSDAAWCWGEGSVGDLGHGRYRDSIVPVQPVGMTSGVTAISSSNDHTCVVQSGAAKCWGLNEYYGMLGVNPSSVEQSSSPVQVPGMETGVTAIAAGTRHSCAVKDGDVWCWGSNDSKQLGTGSGSGYPFAPTLVAGTSGATAVAAGSSHTCALISGGVKCWGATEHQVGNPAYPSGSGTPVDVPGLSDVTAIEAGWSSTCALASGGLKCWGGGQNGELGDGNAAVSTTPVTPTGLGSGVTDVAVGGFGGCAVVSGAAKCWGDGVAGRLGNGTTDVDAAASVQVIGLTSGVTNVETGFSHSCATTTTGALCWGGGTLGAGALGHPTWSPELVDGGDTWGPGNLPAPTISASRSPAANAAGWNNEPVTVSFTCSTPSLASCTSPVTLSGDGADQSVTGTVTDTAGGSASTTVSGISIDQVAPTLTGVAATAPNAAGWYHEPIAVDWTCSDALSGIASGACPASSSITGEGTAVSASASVADRAGNQATASSETVKVDLTKPSTGVSAVPTWATSDVTLTLTPTDGLSGVDSTSYRVDGGAVQSGTAPVVSGQGVHSVEFWSTDAAGNVENAQTVQVSIDVQAPSITASVSPAPNAAGWNNGPVTVTFDCGDETGGSGVASCTAPQDLTSETDTSVTGTVTDTAGNTASVQQPVRIDLTAPSVTADVPSANANGWFNAPVQVPFTCSDTGGSGVASCPAPAMFSGEGANQPVTGQAVDAAGNTASASGATVSIDTTLPTISGAALQSPNPGGGYDGPVTVRWTCADALSGVTTCPADQQVAGEGVHVVSGSVSDRAGNTASAQVTIQINHDPMTDPGIVRGSITDAVDGQPVTNATVTLVAATPQLTTMYKTKSGTDGTYTFPVVADGAYKLLISNNGTHLPSWYPNKTRDVDAPVLTIAHGTNLVADQALARGHVLEGHLTNAAGQPVSGATVRVQGGGVDYSATSDADGRYAVTGMVAGSRTVSIYAAGYQPVSVAASIPATTVLDRTLTATGPSSGVKGTIRALTMDGTPLAGATVRVWLQNGLSPVARITTGTDGRFELPSLPAGNYQFDVVRSGYQVRWFGDTLSRPSTFVTLSSACTSTPDTSWGDPCATPITIRMIKP